MAADQVALGDLAFFVGRIAGKGDDLHAVAQRSRDGIEHIRGGDEHHPAEVERHRKIIIAERVVLLGIEHFEQRRAGIALDAAAELIDFIEHHDATARSGLADGLDDIARQGADIGAPVTADLGFIMHAAKADAHEFAVHGARDRLPQRGLADAGRSHEAQNWRLSVRGELADRQIFDDPPLDLFKAEMILIEDAPCFGNIDRGFLGKVPGQFDQPIEISTHHAVFCRSFRHALEPPQFLASLILDLLGHFRLGDRLVQFGHLGGLAFIALAELALDRRHLLTQQNFALALVEGHLGLAADLLGQSQNLDAVGKQARDLFHPRRDVDGLQDVLLVVSRQIRVGRDEIGERGGGFESLDGGNQLRRRLRQ